MLSISISQLVEQIVRQELLGRGRESEALYLAFSLDLCHYHDGDSLSERRKLHLLYHQYPGSNTVTVFSNCTESFFSKVREVQSWEHETSHDTCWRDIQVFSEVYFDMAERINKNLPSPVRPMDMREHNTFPLFNDRIWQWLPVRVGMDPACSNRYRRTVTLL